MDITLIAQELIDQLANKRLEDKFRMEGIQLLHDTVAAALRKESQGEQAPTGGTEQDSESTVTSENPGTQADGTGSPN